MPSRNLLRDKRDQRMTLYIAKHKSPKHDPTKEHLDVVWVFVFETIRNINPTRDVPRGTDIAIMQK